MDHFFFLKQALDVHLYSPHSENALGLFSTFQSISVIYRHIRIVSQFPAIGVTFRLEG